MKQDLNSFEVIVVGGGHAGTEAALASSRMGSRTLLLTHNIDTLGQMSCNPAIGGIGKSHLVKEIDAMGGIMGVATDHAGIQFRTLNSRKGPAVRATRAQADRSLYKQFIRHALETQPNLTLFQQAVDDLIIENGAVSGVITQMGLRFYSQQVVLTVGTFLGGTIHIGDVQKGGGRAGDPPAIALANTLRALPFRVGRLKTGTPPRIDGRSIDFNALPEQPGDTPTPIMSFLGNANQHPRQVACHISRTTPDTHTIITNNISRSAMYSGNIEGVGPRYCPSIEDKVMRFADRDSHQVFLEPEGLHTHEYYPNGISTSLPFDVQLDFVRSMEGLHNAHITRPGYAIEYDYFDPRDLFPTLETKLMPGLFFAGQINGTTGYEEAGAQGLLAGINASLRGQSRDAWIPKRSNSYIGVLVDDLTTRGTQEPYRMFTSRAEYRLQLRQDNADARLTPLGFEFGCVDETRHQAYLEKEALIANETSRLSTVWSQPQSAQAHQLAETFGETLSHAAHALDLLKRPAITLDKLHTIDGFTPNTPLPTAVCEQVEVRTKYAGYIDRQRDEIERASHRDDTPIPSTLHYNDVIGLSNELKQKLNDVLPLSIGQANRIPGMTPAAISLLLIHLKRKHTATAG